jgi:Ca2+:H+ antiporter
MVTPGAESLTNGSANTHHDVEAQSPHSDDEEHEEPSISLPVTIGLLVVVTVVRSITHLVNRCLPKHQIVAVTAEWLVDSIDGMTNGGGISKEFVGIILLPIAGNAAEHVTAVTVSVKDKLSLSLGVAVGSSIVSTASFHVCVKLKAVLTANCAICHSVSTLNSCLFPDDD